MIIDSVYIYRTIRTWKRWNYEEIRRPL